MSDEDRLVMSRGTLTAGIDLEEVAAMRRRMEKVNEAICDIEPPRPADIPMRTFIIAGAVIGCVVWLLQNGLT